ncbi:MAG: DUF2157 domain-containing protein [Syntrophobacteraceae bacterium]
MCRSYSAVAWFFLGSLFYGASIMLIAQIYHIDEHYPDGIFWWAMGVLPIALLTESTFILILTVCLGFIWFFVESFLNFYPALFPVFMAPICWHLGRGRQSNILFLLLVATLVFWAEYTVASLLSDTPGFRPGGENVALCVGLFLAFLAVWLVYKARASTISISAFGLFFIVCLLAVMQVQDKSLAPLFQFADNIVLVATGIWLIILGIQNGISHYFYLEVLTALTTGMLRYIDLVGDYIGTAILFGIVAAIMLIAARYWRSHSVTIAGNGKATLKDVIPEDIIP